MWRFWVQLPVPEQPKLANKKHNYFSASATSFTPNSLPNSLGMFCFLFFSLGMFQGTGPLCPLAKCSEEIRKWRWRNPEEAAACGKWTEAWEKAEQGRLGAENSPGWRQSQSMLLETHKDVLGWKTLQDQLRCTRLHAHAHTLSHLISTLPSHNSSSAH